MEYYNLRTNLKYANAVLNRFNTASHTHRELLYARNSINDDFVRVSSALLAEHGIGLCVTHASTITRNSGISYEVDRAMRKPNIINVGNGTEIPQMQEQFVKMVYVSGQITDTFETFIPRYLTIPENHAVELINISLALKVTPKHRVRVIQSNNVITVFTNKSWADDNYKVLRKTMAAIPIMFNYQDVAELTPIVDILKLLDNDDATAFVNAVNNYMDTIPSYKDAVYFSLSNALKTLNQENVEQYKRKADECESDIKCILSQYADLLKTQRMYQLQYVDALNNETGLSDDVIKMLVDKRIAYNVSEDYRRNNSRFVYRCASFLLSYDKDAARKYIQRSLEDDDLIDFYTLLFIDEKVLMEFDEEIHINFADATVDARTSRMTNFVDYNLAIPNPHHAFYNCWGSYSATITKLIRENKYEELFFQIKAAVGSLNFCDYTVLGSYKELMTYIVNGNYKPKCFYWKDEGCTTAHTYAETINHFKENAQ